MSDSNYMPIGDNQRPDDDEPRIFSFNQPSAFDSVENTTLIAGTSDDDGKQMIVIGLKGKRQELLNSLVTLPDGQSAFLVAIDKSQAKLYARAVMSLAKKIDE